VEYIDQFTLWLANLLYKTWQQVGWIFTPDILKLKPLLFLDIIILSFVIYWAYLLIKKTSASKYLPAILAISFAAGLGRLLDLTAVNWVFSRLVIVIAVAIPIVFQSEIKEALGLMASKNDGEPQDLPEEVPKKVNKKEKAEEGEEEESDFIPFLEENKEEVEGKAHEKKIKIHY
jgi:DNA integrity scanning protein DisA with diadenylate cyclase activity